MAYDQIVCPQCRAGLTSLKRFVAIEVHFVQSIAMSADGERLEVVDEEMVHEEPMGDVTWECTACERMFDYDIARDFYQWEGGKSA